MIFIRGNVPSSKNSKRIVRHGNKNVIIWSKAATEYTRVSKPQWLDNKAHFLRMIEDKEPPYKIGFHFVRSSRHKYDFVNPLQTVQDLMVKYDWIEDDNITIVIPIPIKINNEYTSYDKDNPGVYINVLNT